MRKVTIVTPVYKVENFIAETVRSVIDQTYPCIEFILTDDHGGDRSIEIAKEMLSKVKRDGFTYRIVDYGCNNGVSVARNEAMKAATGDYLFCLDSDDKINSDCIEKLVQRAEETDAEVVICGHYSDDGNNKLGGHLSSPIDELKTNNECLSALANCWFNVAPWCKLMKRDFIQKNELFFYPGIINEDVLWCFKLCTRVSTVAFLKEDLYYYRLNENSIMWKSKKEIILNSNRIILEEMTSIIKENLSLKSDQNVFNLWMRQLINYFTISATNTNFLNFKKEIGNYEFDTLRSTFPYNTFQLPIYYKLWSIALGMSNTMRLACLYSLIKIYALKK